MFEVLRIAPLSSVQDAGRLQWRALGVPLAGPLDDWSHAVANMLVGNPNPSAALEIGFGRSEFLFERPALIALTGARANVFAGSVALPRWRPVQIAAGTRVRIDPARDGQRVYLAVAGGFDTALVLGSRSSSPGAGIGVEVLTRGQRLNLTSKSDRLGQLLPPGSPPRCANWWVDAEPLLDLEGGAALRLMTGSHVGLLANPYAPYTQDFGLSRASNRMAAPLLGAPLSVSNAAELVSEPVFPGTLQLPPDGLPVLLLADAQTIGGYPRIGHLAAVDLARIAQRRPDSKIRFEPIGVEAARRLWIWRRQRLARMAIAVSARLHEILLR